MRGSPCLGTSDVGGHESLMPGAGATDGRRQARVGSGKALLRRLFFLRRRERGERTREKLQVQAGETSELLAGTARACGSFRFQKSSVLEGLGPVRTPH